jgi:hypothetical protein
LGRRMRARTFGYGAFTASDVTNWASSESSAVCRCVPTLVAMVIRFWMPLAGLLSSTARALRFLQILRFPFADNSTIRTTQASFILEGSSPLQPPGRDWNLVARRSFSFDARPGARCIISWTGTFEAGQLSQARR